MPQDQFIQVGPIKTRYWQAGESGSVVVLLHGIGCSVVEWQRNIDALASSHRVYAIDLLGFGLTDKPEDESYSLHSLANFVLQFLRAAGIKQAHLAGNSLGGRIALLCASLAPDQILSTLLVDPAGIACRETLFEFRLATLPIIGELFTRPNRLGTKMLWRKAFHDPVPFVTDELVSLKTELASLPGAQAAFLKTLRGFVEFRGFKAGPVRELQSSLPHILAPCLVVWGAEDRLVPAAHADILAKAMPNVEVEIWAECGHVPQIECAARFNDAALAFWRGVDQQVLNKASAAHA